MIFSSTDCYIEVILPSSIEFFWYYMFQCIIVLVDRYAFFSLNFILLWNHVLFSVQRYLHYNLKLIGRVQNRKNITEFCDQ